MKQYSEYKHVEYQITLITLKKVNEFVRQYHRTHREVLGYKFALSVTDGEETIGVAIIGSPNSHYRDNGKTIEVTIKSSTNLLKLYKKVCYEL